MKSLTQAYENPWDVPVERLVATMGYEVLLWSVERMKHPDDIDDPQPYWDIKCKLGNMGRVGLLRFREYRCSCCDPWKALMTWEESARVQEMLREHIQWDADEWPESRRDWYVGVVL